MLTLAVTRFEAAPSVVSDILQLEPTSVANRGERGKSGRPYSWNGWWLEVHPSRIQNGEEHARAISTMLDYLRGREAAFRRLRAEVEPGSVTLYGAIYTTADSQCGVWLDPADMTVLVDCDIGWGVDLFVE